MKTRIVLVDDHRMFAEGIAALIGARGDMVLSGIAENGRQALARVEELTPDLVIIDVGMPEMNGIESVKLLKEMKPDIRILALSGHQEHHIVIDMLRAGASGYVLKNASFSELVEAIHVAMDGSIFISPALSGPLVMDLVNGKNRDLSSAFSVLTNRELEILQSITEGKSTKEIAAALTISVKTVETHRQQIMEKLNLHSIAELTRYAIREEVTPV